MISYARSTSQCEGLLFFLACQFLHSLSRRGIAGWTVFLVRKVELGMSSLHVLLLYQMPFMEPRSVKIDLVVSSSGEKERDCGGD